MPAQVECIDIFGLLGTIVSENGLPRLIQKTVHLRVRCPKAVRKQEMSCGIPYLNIGNLSSLASCTLQCIAIDGLTANLAPALYPMHNRKGLCALVPSISQNGIVPVQPATYRSNLLTANHARWLGCHDSSEYPLVNAKPIASDDLVLLTVKQYIAAVAIHSRHLHTARRFAALPHASDSTAYVPFCATHVRLG